MERRRAWECALGVGNALGKKIKLAEVTRQLYIGRVILLLQVTTQIPFAYHTHYYQLVVKDIPDHSPSRYIHNIFTDFSWTLQLLNSTRRRF